MLLDKVIWRRCVWEKQCRSIVFMTLFFPSTSQPKCLSQSELIKGLTKTKSNRKRIVNEYVRYGFPLAQSEST